jgi:hypothetical protein
MVKVPVELVALILNLLVVLYGVAAADPEVITEVTVE